VAHADAAAHARLVTRLEDRGLLTRILYIDDRRGIYTELTASGRNLYGRARPIHSAALSQALEDAASQPELAPLVAALHNLALPPVGAA
jgi:DNA-binding MarR family transcriptional regulator